MLLAEYVEEKDGWETEGRVEAEADLENWEPVGKFEVEEETVVTMEASFTSVPDCTGDVEGERDFVNVSEMVGDEECEAVGEVLVDAKGEADQVEQRCLYITLN